MGSETADLWRDRKRDISIFRIKGRERRRSQRRGALAPGLAENALQQQQQEKARKVSLRKKEA